MTQIRIFKMNEEQILEEAVNEWIKKNHLNVVDIRFFQDKNYRFTYSAIVIYKIAEGEEINND